MGAIRENNKNILFSKFLGFPSLFKEFLFYRHIFTLKDILRGCLSYLFYILFFNKRTVKPLTVNFLITSSCNFQCKICSFNTSRNLISNGITLKDIEKFVREQSSYKPFIMFSGGEPIIREDFMDILGIIKKYKYKCGVNTNAYLLDNEKIKKIIMLEIDLIIFSLYGPEEIHDLITGIKGSYLRSAKNIILFCKQKRKKTGAILSCTITKTNIDSLDVLPLIAKSLGVDALKIEHLNFLNSSEFRKNSKYFDGERHINTFITDFNDSDRTFAEKLIEKLTKIKREYGDFVLIKPDLSSKEIRNWYSEEFNSKRRCFFVWHSIFIRPDGMVVPCQFLLNDELGNIKENNLINILKNDKIFYLKRLLKKLLLPECSRCCKL